MLRQKTIRIIAFLLAAGLFCSTAFARPEEAYRKVEETKQEITELENILKGLSEAIRAREKKINDLDSELSLTEKLLRQAEQDLSSSEARLKEKNVIFSARVRSAYMKGGLSYLEMLLGAESLADLIVRAGYLARILNRDATVLAAVKEEQAYNRERKATLEAQRRKLADLQGQKDAEHRNLLDQRRQKDALLAAAKNKLAGELAKITPQAERLPVYGIVIDNAPKARPQHGLSQAIIMYEYEVEGKITRYLAIFSELPVKVGPIRSAREHSIMLAMENKVTYIYASAGVDVLAKIRDWNITGINALYAKDKSFYRDSSRRAPHNLYLNLSTLEGAVASKEVVIRPAYLSRNGTPSGEITLKYSQNYGVKYKYIADKGFYRRYINDEIHKDATGKEIQARNIIIQYAPHRTDLMGRPTPDIVGEGKIDFYSQGEHFRGTWKKESKGSPTRFYFEDGKEIERVYGQTWIQIARPQ